MAFIYRTPESLRDIIAIAEYIAQDNVSAADRWVDALDGKLTMLAEKPRLGRMRPGLARGLRSFPFGRYVIYYRIRTDGIEMIRVLHGARKTRRKEFVPPPPPNP